MLAYACSQGTPGWDLEADVFLPERRRAEGGLLDIHLGFQLLYPVTRTILSYLC